MAGWLPVAVDCGKTIKPASTTSEARLDPIVIFTQTSTISPSITVSFLKNETVVGVSGAGVVGGEVVAGGGVVAGVSPSI